MLGRREKEGEKYRSPRGKKIEMTELRKEQKASQGQSTSRHLATYPPPPLLGGICVTLLQGSSHLS